jgi:hypothetical protein
MVHFTHRSGQRRRLDDLLQMLAGIVAIEPQLGRPDYPMPDDHPALILGVGLQFRGPGNELLRRVGQLRCG